MTDIKGKVHSFNADEEYGYIISEAGQAFFVHTNDCNRKNPDETLSPGDAVLFEACPNRKDNVATNVRKT